MIKNDIIISQNSNVVDSEYIKLRSLLGWDNNTLPLSSLKDKLYTYFTARENDKLVGFVDALSDGVADAYIQDLMVHPNFQHRGIGSNLMKNIIHFLQSKNIKCIQVTFGPELETFFKKFGFHIFRAGIIDRDYMDVK